MLFNIGIDVTQGFFPPRLLSGVTALPGTATERQETAIRDYKSNKLSRIDMSLCYVLAHLLYGQLHFPQLSCHHRLEHFWKGRQKTEALLSDQTHQNGIMPRLAALTEAGLQFNEAPDETVEVNGVLRISISTDNRLQDVGVELETWWRKKEEVIAVSHLLGLCIGGRIMGESHYAASPKNLYCFLDIKHFICVRQCTNWTIQSATTLLCVCEDLWPFWFCLSRKSKIDQPALNHTCN